jgi:Cof subfamily protein (haloacid dehalogenase superfamily)
MADSTLRTYKAIISDFDGTLVGADFQVSTRVKDAIRRWKDSSRHFSIATGKAFPGIIEHVCRELALTDPIIVTGGAQIIHPQTGAVIHTEYLAREDVKEILEILRESDILYEIQTDTAVYASSPKLQVLQPHKKYEALTSFTLQDVLLIRLITTQDRDNVEAFIRGHITERYPDLSIIESDTPYSTGVNITAKHATKQSGVRKIAELMQIRPQEIIGIGDGVNDRSLFTACGYNVAMANAPEALQAIADETIPDYTHDGIAVFIDQIFA